MKCLECGKDVNECEKNTYGINIFRVRHYECAKRLGKTLCPRCYSDVRNDGHYYWCLNKECGCRS